MQHVTEVAFNEIQLATDHTSTHEPNDKRAIVTCNQAKMLVDAISLDEIHTKKKLIVDISTMRPWNKSLQCYLMLDVFRSGTMEVEKRKFRTQYVHIKYFEASWPGALVAHRIQPLHGSMHAHTNTSPRSVRPRSKLRIHVAQSNGRDSGLYLAQRRRQRARSADIFGARGQHCSGT